MAGQPRIPRRTFVKSIAAAAVATAAAGTGLLVVERTRDRGEVPVETGWRRDDARLLFRQDLLDADAEVHRSGCRRSAAPTAGYAHDTVAKASVVADQEDPRLRFPGPLAGLVVPAPGLLPRDEWAAQLEVRNASSGDVTELAPPAEPIVLFTAGATVLWLLDPEELAVSDLASDQHVRWQLAPGDWPAGAWRRFTVRWRGDDSTLAASFGSSESGHLVAGRPGRTPPPVSDPPGGVDDGIALGGAPVEDQPFEIRGLEIRRSFAADGGAERPTVTVDAGETLGAWAPGLSGTLGVAAGFDLEVGSTSPDVRDRQYELVFDEAGSRLVRIGGPLQLVDITLGDGPSAPPRYGWDRLDAHLDALLASRPHLRLHLTLDFTPEVLQPPGTDHRAPPTDPGRWAEVATDVVAHVADRYGDQLASISLWNEPDLDDYWTGTAEQLVELWATTQRALLAAGSPHLLGNPEYASTAALEGFFTWLADQPEDLRTSVAAIYVHDFQQDLRLVRERLRTVRAAADAAGVGPVPVRITEYNLALGQLAERREDPASWYATQPPHFTSEYAAAYAVHFLWEVLDETEVDTAAYAAIGAQELYFGEQALVTSDGPDVRPYPAWSTIALLARLGGQRIAAVSDGPSVRALATLEDDGAVTVVYANFRPYRGFLEDVPFRLRWSGLPASYTWTQWQLDRDHLEDDRMVVVGEGDQDDLPDEVRLGALGVGGIRIVPAG